ncbi:adenosylcobinamide-phosphate synthase CbiB [Ahrensia marina]|uniref:Cobalamin biosynthesis protein CobD n=1 Tax=Ahrensia marina TaxID=1514904 RepID=A0A0M9GQ38_9HYPH|nr:adenosylcobinamide-phosphate synthase CbiB [Ahrensia marina]KPB02779.1 cobalamin biosynthesis protein CobD [Ahrensia marina]
MILGTSTFLILLLALILDRFIGDPDWLWQKIPHPVVAFGAAISWADTRYNHSHLRSLDKEKRGFVVIGSLMIMSIICGWIISVYLLRLGILGLVLETVIVAIFLAQKSLAAHVGLVASGLREDGLKGGRAAVSMIVGRNPETLDEAAVCRAAIESLAENASDGVVAPAFWYVIFGLPGLFAYKMLNTADSMIGHLNDKYRDFGRASAKLDDLSNYVPARLTGALIVLASKPAQWRQNLTVMLRDASLHRSPNAGWPESAMAGVSGLALGGPRIYAGDVVDEPFMNDRGNRNASASDIERAISIYWRAMLIGTLILASIVLIGWLFGR